MTKEQLFRILVASRNERDRYFESLPSEISQFVVDNGYTRSLGRDYDMLLQHIFQDDVLSVEWFLYDWKPGYAVGIEGEDQQIINSLDDYINWLKDHDMLKDS